MSHRLAAKLSPVHAMLVTENNDFDCLGFDFGDGIQHCRGITSDLFLSLLNEHCRQKHGFLRTDGGAQKRITWPCCATSSVNGAGTRNPNPSSLNFPWVKYGITSCSLKTAMPLTCAPKDLDASKFSGTSPS